MKKESKRRIGPAAASAIAVALGCWGLRSPDFLLSEAVRRPPGALSVCPPQVTGASTRHMQAFWYACDAYATGRIDEARAAWRRAGAARYLLTRADAAWKRSEYELARTLYVEAWHAGAPPALALTGEVSALHMLASLGRAPWSTMLRRARVLRHADPGATQSRYLYAYGLYMADAGQDREAESEARWVVQQRDYWGDGFLLGLILSRQRRYAEAIPFIRRAYEQAGHEEILFRLVMAAKHAGDLQALGSACGLGPVSERVTAACTSAGNGNGAHQ